VYIVEGSSAGLFLHSPFYTYHEFNEQFDVWKLNKNIIKYWSIV